MVPVLPGPAALDLKLQCHAEKRANDNGEAQDDYVVEGGVYHDRTNDVSCDKELDPQKEASSHILTANAIGIERASLLAEEKVS
jgi:hypothetical protein